MRYAVFTGLLAIAGVHGRVVSHIEGSETVEYLRSVPQGWRDVGSPSENHKLHFRIAVRSVSTTSKLLVLVLNDDGEA